MVTPHPGSDARTAETRVDTVGKKNNGNGDDQQNPEVPKDIQEHLEDIDRKIWEEELKDEG